MATSSAPSNVFFARLRERILKNVERDQGKSLECWIWQGGKKAPDSKYGRIRITYVGVTQSIGAHRSAYMAFKETFDLEHDISYRCHNTLCVNPDHLPHEERSVNAERSTCVPQGFCIGHSRSEGQLLKPCII